ncbi:MAG TPA: penicillin acylase family protein, partial [Myxococcota bacterium]|nr:penicillin acylase family protein [Myxococcota bacterium]
LPVLAPRLGELGIDLARVVRAAFVRSVGECVERMGADPARWSWGRMHRFWGRHRFHSSPLRALFSLGPLPAGGGPDTVCRGDIDGGNGFDMRVGASVRFVASARDHDQALSILPGGQSGRRFSAHYDDQLAEYLAGRLKPAPMQAHGWVRQVLLPLGFLGAADVKG